VAKNLKFYLAERAISTILDTCFPSLFTRAEYCFVITGNGGKGWLAPVTGTAWAAGADSAGGA